MACTPSSGTCWCLLSSQTNRGVPTSLKGTWGLRVRKTSRGNVHPVASLVQYVVLSTCCRNFSANSTPTWRATRRLVLSVVNCSVHPDTHAAQQQTDEPGNRLSDSKNVAETTVAANWVSASCRLIYTLVVEYVFLRMELFSLTSIDCTIPR